MSRRQKHEKQEGLTDSGGHIASGLSNHNVLAVTSRPERRPSPITSRSFAERRTSVLLFSSFADPCLVRNPVDLPGFAAIV